MALLQFRDFKLTNIKLLGHKMQLLSHQVFYITPLTVLFCVCFSVELFQSEAKKKKKGNKKQCIVLDTNLQCGRQTEEIKSVRHMIHVQINRSVCV